VPRAGEVAPCEAGGGTDASGASGLTRYPTGWLKTLTDGAGKVVTCDYNPLGQIGAITTPEGGIYAYSYDPMERLAGVVTPTGAAISLGYDDGGRLRHIVRPGSTIEYQYNARDWVTAVLNHATGGATLFDSSYAYHDGDLWDHTGNPLVRTEVTGGTTYATTYRYDALGRLTEEARTPGDYSRSYGYDLVGNRTSETRDGVGFTYGYDDNNKLTSLTGGGKSAGFGYDGNGSMTSVSGDMFGSWSLVYDDANRPTSIAYPAGADTYVYNAFGQRTRANLSGAIFRYVYNGDRVLEQTDDAGNLLSRYATAGASYYGPLLEFEFPDGSQVLAL
jgi:YD repeat-containing protein